MFNLPPYFFGSGSHVIHLPFRPFSLEILTTLECLLLGETCRASFAVYSGPVPNLLLFAPWSENFPNSPLFPHINNPWLPFANYWLMFLQFMYGRSQFSPLPLTLLSTIRRELLVLIETHTKHTVSCSLKAEILLSHEAEVPCFLTTLTVSRPYFEFSAPPIQLGNHWLHLREHFDSKSIQLPTWSLEDYLRKHSNSYSQFISRQNSKNSCSPSS